MAKVGILGSGSFGTALAFLMSNNGHNVTLWSHNPDEAFVLKKERENKSKLPGVILPDDISFTGDIKEATKGKDILVLAVPSVAVRDVAKRISGLINDGEKIVSVAKGIEESTLLTVSGQLNWELPRADIAVLSGPSHAEEVARALPTTCVIGAKTKETATYLQNLFMSDVFRVYISSDILGMEIGGALKNVIALAAGVADGLGFGDNTKAALITRGMAEISRLGVKMGGNIESFAGLTGMGDLIVTCASRHSRNRRAGYLIGQGKSLKEALREVNMVVEGVHTAKAALKLSHKYDVSMPIVEQINAVLFDGKNPGEAVRELMTREGRSELTFPDWK